MGYTEADRFKHAVIETSRILAGTATGSNDGTQVEELRELRDWLAWRINEGWRPSSCDGAVLVYIYEEAVLDMAQAALLLFNDRCGSWLVAK